MDFLIGRQYGRGMSAHTLKTIAIVAMVVDHEIGRASWRERV